MHNILEEQPLPQLDEGAMELANWQTQLGRSVFALGQTNFTIAPSKTVAEPIGLQITVDGKSGVVGVSASLVNRFLEQFGMTTTQLSKEWLGFLLRAHHTDFLPKGVQIESVCEAPESYTASYSANQYGETRELFQFGIGQASFTEVELISAFGVMCVGKVPSPVEKVPLALPLVATSMEVPAEDLVALAVGDILLVG